DGAPPTSAQNGTGGAVDYQGLWGRPGESGWGLNVAHQGDTLFVSWFTYDANGRPTWYYGSNVAKTGTGTYSGTLYRNTGPALGSAWNVAAVSNTAVGNVTLSFQDGAHGTFSYSVNGVQGSKAVTRDVFASPVTVCH